ncbi:MAG TPA: hypothetical protein VIS99_13875, partial [Terrimicrobiaceae bacterium]
KRNNPSWGIENHLNVIAQGQPVHSKDQPPSRSRRLGGAHRLAALPNEIFSGFAKNYALLRQKFIILQEDL